MLIYSIRYQGLSEGSAGYQALNMGIQALEKQEPKKPIDVPEEYKPNKLCPNCKEFLLTKGFYCDICGQAIDWSKDE